MRIGIITHNYPLHSNDRKDAGIFLYDFAHKLAEQHQVFILCPDFIGNKEKYLDVPVTWFKWTGGGQKLGSFNVLSITSWRDLFSLLSQGRSATVKFYDDNKLDFCLAAWVFPAGFLIWSANKKRKIQYATWSLGSDINKYARLPFLKEIMATILTSAAIRYANSRDLCKKIEKLSGKSCNFLPAVTDFMVGGVPEKKLDLDKTNFLFVGRLETVKGPDILLEAVKRLREERLDFKVWIVGDGSMMNYLKEYAKKNHIESFVELTGIGDKDVVASYMKGADCIIIPSRSESLPLVLLESATVKLPVIAANVGDCAYIVGKYKIGEIFKKDNSEDLADKMKGFILKKKNAFSKADFVGIEKEFSQKNAVNKFVSDVKKNI